MAFGETGPRFLILSRAFPAMAWYKEWFGTRYYSLLYGHRDESDARSWVDAIVRHGGLQAGQRMLDMGCGRGRHAYGFTQHGLHVTGVDISEASIVEARKRAPGADFLVHDMRVPLFTAEMDVVVCLFTSLGYSDDREDDRKAVRAAAQALKPGGLFVLDLLNGCTVREGLVEEERIAEGGVDFALKRRLEGDVLVKEIFVKDGTEECSFMERVHAWRVEEVKDLVLAAGLTLVELTDGPEPKPFVPGTSQRIVAWARRS